MSAAAKGREMMEKATRAIRLAELLLAAGDARESSTDRSLCIKCFECCKAAWDFRFRNIS
uniref:Uncharacterized protein n=1 Tax=Candidatus Kentrum sp. FW TaxID=2126338 RepID=A0A450TA13_9GAMM|nr:MAG: hypothetical protein BECKFW1821C_GA0114237_100427 [Candidatus Kentron sp. FW]